MKKKIFITLIVVTMLISFVGCGNGTEKNTEKENDKIIEKTTESDSGTESDKITSDVENESNGETQTIINNDDIFVEYRGISEYSSDSWIINLYIENKSDKEFYVNACDVIVDGCNITISNNNNSISAGSKYLAESNFSYIISAKNLAAYGIEKMTNLTFTLKVAEEWAGDAVYEEKVSSSLSKPLSGLIDNTTIADSKLLLENDDVKVSYCGIAEYSDSSWILNLYMENKSDTEKYLDVDNLLVNGYSIRLANGNYAVPAQCKFLAFPTFKYVINTKDLEAYGISDIESIDFTLNIKNEWLGDSIYSVPVNLNK